MNTKETVEKIEYVNLNRMMTGICFYCMFGSVSQSGVTAKQYYSIVRYGTVQYSTVQYNTALYNSVVNIVLNKKVH